MVKLVVVSEYIGPPECAGINTKISGGPLYELVRVQQLARKDLVLWTRKCASNVAALGWDADDVAGLIEELTGGHYVDSEWCQSGNAWAAADAYVIRRSEWIESARKSMQIEYFVKFAIGKLGNVVLTVSCHT